MYLGVEGWCRRTEVVANERSLEILVQYIHLAASRLLCLYSSANSTTPPFLHVLHIQVLLPLNQEEKKIRPSSCTNKFGTLDLHLCPLIGTAAVTLIFEWTTSALPRTTPSILSQHLPPSADRLPPSAFPNRWQHLSANSAVPVLSHSFLPSWNLRSRICRVPLHSSLSSINQSLAFKFLTMTTDMDIEMDIDMGLAEDDFAIPEIDIVPDTQTSVRSKAYFTQTKMADFTFSSITRISKSQSQF
jgi:hypothetical protein